MIEIHKVLSEETKQKRTETFYKKALEKAEEEVGKKYNHLTIIAVDYERTFNSYFGNGYNAIFVHTKCDCGNNSKPSNQLRSLKSGHVKSCGCVKFNNPLVIDDLTGRKFGRLTVLRRDLGRDISNNIQGKRRVHWLCQCECGNPILSSVEAYQLKTGHTQSCGCYASEQTIKRNKKFSTKVNDYKENNDGTMTIYDDAGNSCLIDREDYAIVKRWYWRKIERRGRIEKGYWATNVKDDDKYDKSILLIHQVIAEIKYGEYDSEKQFPDHLSRNTNDNRKCNILLKSNKDNCKNRGISKANSSGKTGVSFNKEQNVWVAYITVNYKTIRLGAFSDFDKAVQARKKAEERYGFTCDEVVAAYDGDYENELCENNKRGCM